MSKRLSILAATLAAACALLATLPIAHASASGPWWQVLTGSRPTNMWMPTNNVQEVEGTIDSETGVLTARIEVEGQVIGCLGAGSFFGVYTPDEVCSLLGIAPEATETAAELEADLESAFGTSSVDVTGGPAGAEPFVVTTQGTGEPAIALSPVFGTASSKVVSNGGSGRLVLTITNLGDASLDATGTPLKITDELPEGVSASGVEAFAGDRGTAGPVSCSVEAADLVSCNFDSSLPPYEAIEVEIFANLTGEPPAAGGPGQVTVSGGNAAPATAVQQIHVSPEEAPFGIEQFSAGAEEEGGTPTIQAGGHPFQLTTTIQLNSGPVSPGSTRRFTTVKQPALYRNGSFELPVGLVGNARAMPECEFGQLFEVDLKRNCPPTTAVGVASVTFVEPLNFGLDRLAVPLFNLSTVRGEPARFGFNLLGTTVVIDTEIDPDQGDRVVAKVRNATQLAELLSASVVFWGTPGDPRHDSSRGWQCVTPNPEIGSCQRPQALSTVPLLRMPVTCRDALEFQAAAEPWNVPLETVIARSEFRTDPMVGCNQVPFDPRVNIAPTSNRSEGSGGLSVELHMPNSGLLDREAISEGQAKKVEVTLPEGVTVNPSQANGLGVCTPEEYSQETFESGPGSGCPEASKIGTVDISTPLLEEEAHGAVYVAAPHDNPFDSLLGLYVVAKIPSRGILVKQAGKVELNPETGQLVTTFDDLPQIPFNTFDLHFKEGDRAPLVMPSSCGKYDIMAKFTPWNAADPNNPQPNEIVTRASSFTIDHGPDGGACPSGTPPFNPGFTAGTTNNAAGRYSPLDVRLTRQDGEQEFRTFSLKMPKGLVGKLAGIPFCSDAAIAAARARTGPNGGQEELEHPSCPDASQIGRTLVGAGVGPTLTYAPGKLYLAGPYKGAKMSVVAITTAKVGPFDLGNVVIRQGLTVDPDTAAVSTDGSSGDPIPHILQGIVVHARDIRIYVDRKEFVLNPTSCERMQAAASVLGSGGASDDVASPFQAADCASLGFKPKLALSLRGGTKRGANPRLKAVLTARKGDANIGAAVVKLPHSEFLEQGHIRTICTRVQFAAGSGNGSQCPKGSVYGRVRAISPLLDEPLVGPVYLRSSNHPLPDLVAALHSKKVDINLDGRIDSVNGGIRNTFEEVPDAPVTKFVLEMQGGRKGLLVNSTDICHGKHRAKVSFTGQNGKRHALSPLVKARCGGKAKGRHKH